MGHRPLTLEGRYYDGEQSRGQACRMEVAAHGGVRLSVAGPAGLRVADIRIPSRLGDSPRHLQFPGGGVFETADHDSVDRLEQAWFGRHRGLVSRLESSLKVALASTLAVVLAGYLFVTLGLPALSEQLVALLPPALDRDLGDTALPQLDRHAFAPSGLPEARRAALRARFDSLVDDKTFDYRLLFRQGGELGANAFALPGGAVIFTDELVQLADDDAMLAAVMLHEIGHVAHRHGMQSLTRQAGLGALALAITGDLSTASSLVILLPTLLVQASYSREFERQADSYALDQMLARGLDPAKFAAMLQRLSRGDGGDDWLQYLQTHPASEARIARLEAAAAGQSPGRRPAD
jgi:Zn-dependent protease with chaperone function